MDPTYPLVPVANFVGCLLILLPMLTCMTYSTGICAFAGWAFLFGLGQGINSIVWKDNTNDIAPLWCDFITRIFLATNVALPACSLVITRRLYLIICSRNSQTPSPMRKYKEFAFDISLSVGFPILTMLFYYVVQADRYDIIEEKGCADHWVASGLSILLLEIWIPLFPAISILFYAPRLVYVYYNNRREIHEYLGSRSSINEGNYFRILALGTTDAFLTLPLAILLLVSRYSKSGAPLVFYQGWDVIHAYWTPERVPASLWKSNKWAAYSVRFDQWICPFLGLVIFLLCGLHKEARGKYQRAFEFVSRRKFGFGKKEPTTSAEASTIRFGSNNAANASGNNPTMISLESLRTAHSSQHSEDDVEVIGNALNELERGRNNSTSSFGAATKFYEPSLAEAVVHEAELDVALGDENREDDYNSRSEYTRSNKS